MLNKWEKERKLHIKIRNYKEESNLQAAKTGDFQFDLEFQEDYLTFLNETSTAVQKLKTRLLARYNEN